MEPSNTIIFIWMVILTPISVGTTLAVAWWFVRRQSDSESGQQVSLIWARRQEWGEATCRELIEGRLQPGMTSEMVRLAWGDPVQVDEHSSDTVVWGYRNGAQVEFAGGAVAGVTGERPQGFGLSAGLVLGILFLLAFIASLVVFVVLFLL